MPILGVDVGPMREEELKNPVIVRPDGVEERRAPMLILGTVIGAQSQQVCEQGPVGGRV